MGRSLIREHIPSTDEQNKLLSDLDAVVQRGNDLAKRHLSLAAALNNTHKRVVDNKEKIDVDKAFGEEMAKGFDAAME